MDSAGNQTTAGTSVTFDFTAPTLTPTVAPNPANALASPALTVASDKPLNGAPSVTVTPSGAVTGAVTPGVATGGGTSWGFPMQVTGADGTFTVGVQGTDTVGHVSTATTPFTVDALPPSITAASVATDRQTYSEVSPFNVITLTFSVAKQATVVTVSGGAATWNPCTYAAPTYTCISAPLTTSLGSGTKTIAITTTDEVANSPRRALRSFSTSWLPCDAHGFAEPVQCGLRSGAGDRVEQASLTVSVVSITLATGTGAVTAAAVSGTGTSWTAALSANGANGVFSISVSGTDLVGHAGTASTSFTVDAIVPTVSALVASTTAGGASQQTFSEVSPWNVVYVMFNVEKPATVSATVDNIAMTCGSYQASAPNYTCFSRALQPTDGSGSQVIAVTASDPEGNTSQATLPIVFDFVPPTLIPTAAPNPSNASSSPVLTIASSKPLSLASVTSITGGTSGAVTAGRSTVAAPRGPPRSTARARTGPSPST